MRAAVDGGQGLVPRLVRAVRRRRAVLADPFARALARGRLLRRHAPGWARVEGGAEPTAALYPGCCAKVRAGVRQRAAPPWPLPRCPRTPILALLALRAAPPGGYSCAQQAAWGKCGADFMTSGGFCAATCGRCGGGSSPSPSGTGCGDIAAPGGYSCAQQARQERQKRRPKGLEEGGAECPGTEAG